MLSVVIRLARWGAKKKPSYRVMVADSRSPRDGKFIEQVGTYDPMADPVQVNIDTEKVEKWIKNGAKPTRTVQSLLKKVAGTV